MAPFSSRRASDATLIAESLGRPEAFAAIFDRHFEAVHAYLARRVGAVAADDLAASTFTIAFERRAGFRAEAESARPWLFGIATNLMRNEWRAQQRALGALAQMARVADVSSSDETELSLGGADGALLARVLRELDEDQREVLLLHAWGGFSYEQTAVALAIPVGTVRSRLARARNRLSAALVSGERSESAASREGQELVE